MDTTANTPEAIAPPVDRDVACPLCEYNLRGLAEPRCPECGYRCEWEDLTDPARRLHPYFFEHHPERDVASFVRTLVGGLRPRRFWAALNPAGPARPRRMIVYWLLTVLAAVPVYAIVYVGMAVPRRAQNDSTRAQLTRYYANPANAAARAQFEGDARMTVQAYLDRFVPPWPTPAFFRRVAIEPPVMVVAVVAVAWALWPWVTAALLRVVLWSSLRRARVRAIHLLRCSVYCADAMVWVFLAAGAVAAWETFVRTILGGRTPLFSPGGSLVPETAMLMAAWGLAVLAGLLVVLYRLTVAYRCYLRLPHAAAVVVLTQAIVLVVVMIITGSLLRLLA